MRLTNNKFISASIAVTILAGLSGSAAAQDSAEVEAECLIDFEAPTELTDALVEDGLVIDDYDDFCAWLATHELSISF